MSKYERWYRSIVVRGKRREIPTCYTEMHHILPRSLGGGDEPENLVRLTYREHFLAHWLLTKISTGAALRKMQRALFAMTISLSGRITSGWQFEAAKRAIRDLELDPVAEAAWRERFHQARLREIEEKKARRENLLRVLRPAQREANRNLVIEQSKALEIGDKDQLKELSTLFLQHTSHKVRAKPFYARKVKNGAKHQERKRARKKAEEYLASLGLKLNESSNKRASARKSDRL